MKEQDLENNFENRLRQKAEGFERKPSDDVWANVKISLQENKNHRRFLWLWAAAIGLLIGAGTTGWYFMNHSSSTATDQTAVAIDSSASNDRSFEEQQNNATNISDHEINVTKSENSNTALEESNASQQKTTLTNNNQPAFSQNKNQQINSSSDSKAEVSAGILTDDEIQPAALNDVSVTYEVTGLHGENQEDLNPLKNEVVYPVLSPNAPDAAVIIETDRMFAIDIPEALPSHRFSMEAEVIPLVSFLNYKSRGSTNALVLEDQAFVDSVSQVSQSDSKPLIGFSAGLSGNYRISKRFSAGAGIHFTRTGTKNSFPEAGAIETLYDSALFAGTGGTATNSNNTTWFLPTGFEGTTHYNWLDFSLHGEWIFLTDNKNEISWIAGAGLSHFMNYKLTIPDVVETTIQNTSFTKNNQEPPLFHVYNLTGKTGINYRRMISDHFSLCAGVQFQYYLSSITLSSIPISEHPYWLGINTGVSYRF